MGDRANIVVLQGRDLPPVVLYTNWTGYSLPETLRVALAKKWRWDDNAYLTRIIFDTMTEASHDEETGFGISTGLPDNSYALLVVDPDKQEVRVQHAPSWGEESGLLDGVILATFTFKDYVALDEATWDGIMPSPKEED